MLKNKVLHDAVTPNTVCVGLLFNIYLKRERQLSAELTFQERRKLLQGLLTCTQETHPSLNSFVSSVSKWLPEVYVTSFRECAQQAKLHGIDGIIDCFAELSQTVAGTNAAQKRCAVGLWIRRFLVAFDETLSSFSLLCILNNDFKSFCEHEVDIMHNKKQTTFSSKAEALRLLKQQIGLILEGRTPSLSLHCLCDIVTNARKKFPDLAEAHLLSYLIASQQQNIPGSVSSLHDYFDWCAFSKPCTATLSAASKQAPLAMASFYERHGYKDHSARFVNEAILLNREGTNHSFLLQALYALYSLDNFERSSQLLSHLFQECTKHGANSLKLFCELSRCQLNAMEAHEVCNDILRILRLLPQLWSSEEDQISYLNEVVLTTMASLYVKHGWWEMAAALSQKLLHCAVGSAESDLEALCISVCNLCYSMAQYADYDLTSKLMDFVKSTVPSHSDASRHWKVCESILDFDLRCLNASNPEICTGIPCLPFSSNDSNAEMLLRKCIALANASKENDAIQLLEAADKQAQFNRADIRVRMLLTKSEIFSSLGSFGHTLESLGICLKAAIDAKLTYLEALSRTELAMTVCKLIPERSLATLSKPVCCISQTGICAARRLLSKAKCLLFLHQKLSPNMNSQAVHKQLSTALCSAKMSLHIFRKAQCSVYICEALLAAAKLCDLMKLPDEARVLYSDYKTMHIAMN